MDTNKLPESIGKFLRSREWTIDHQWSYYLAAAGRALIRVEMAAEAIEAETKRTLADYHTYAGVAASRSALDAFTCWLNAALDLGFPSGTSINLTRGGFWQMTRAKADPLVLPSLEALRVLAKEIDVYRQPALHREGLSVVADVGSIQSHDELKEPSSPSKWRIIRPGDYGIRRTDPPAEVLLRTWAAAIEREIEVVLHGAPTMPGLE